MALSTYAYTIAIFELVIGIPLLVNAKGAAKWIVQLKDQEGLLRFIGVLFVVLSVLPLISDCSVGTDVAGLVRLLAWIAAIKCLLITWWPKQTFGLSEKMLKIDWVPYLAGACAIALGILLILAGNDLQGSLSIKFN
ncbi:MAG: hypothetical protein JXA52_07685 [Planctomycetes bacterium]|nr:hypothetical protein [Planctomycetota bacterium]